MKKAFTLAEIMIVLTIIAIITAILLPSARNATPDEALMKFKKSNNSLAIAIQELVNSDKYYYNGDLALKPDGSLVDDPKYFCNTLADILSTKSVECQEHGVYDSSGILNLPDILTYEVDGDTIYDLADCMCAKEAERLENESLNPEIILVDDTAIFSVNQNTHFGSKTQSGAAEEKRLFNLCSEEKRYKYVCMDIDGIGKGEPPFGYALRADGKIVYGSKASAWIKAAIQKIDGDEITYNSISTCSATTPTILPENDNCTRVTPSPTPTPVVPTPTPTPEPEPEPPVLAAEDTWFFKQTTIEQNKVVSISFVDSYESTGTEFYSWNASDDNSNPLMAYAILAGSGNYNLIVAGNGSGKIYANSNSYGAFANFEYVKTVSFYNGFDVSKVTDIECIFYKTGYHASSFVISGLSNWDVSKITSFHGAFTDSGYNALSYNIDNVSNWNVSSATRMSNMFSGAGYSATTWSIGNLSSWNMSKVENIDYMFQDAGYGATTFNIGNLSNWNMSKTTSASYAFSCAGENATTWNIGDLSNWDVSNLEDMSGMFLHAGYSSTTWSIGNLSNWDVSNARYMQNMFSNTGYKTANYSLGDLRNWNVSRVKDMHNMFASAGYSSTTWSIGDLSNWNVKKVTNMDYMFQYAGANANYVLDLSSWNVSNVTTHLYFSDYSKVIPPTWVN